MLGHVLFSTFISSITHIVASYGLEQQKYADDTQPYVAISHLIPETDLSRLDEFLSVCHIWFYHNSLALNPKKNRLFYLVLLSWPNPFHLSPTSLLLKRLFLYQLM